jgi:peptidoglycan/LPS O-acetylase OafA/YrhL
MIDATQPAQPAAKFRYIPGLDGIRGFWVVLGPLMYHARPEWIPGGILGIDLFFVLSSYLIVSILLNEWDRNGRIDVKAYAGRRAKRLLPAMFALLLFLTWWLIAFGEPHQVSRWTGSIIATLTYSANWHEIVSGVSYFDQFQEPSPLRHVWSFAIEEQFYVFAPLFLIGVLRWGGRWRNHLLLGLAFVGAVASAWWMAELHTPGQDPSRAYYGTDTRAHSLLIGIVFAMAVRMWGPVRTEGGRKILVAGAYVSTAVIGTLIFTISEKTSWMFEYGGFFGVAVMSGFMVVGIAQSSSGPLHRFLEAAPTRWVGKISYGLYLYHWPVYVLASEDRIGLSGNTLLVFHLALTFAIATASWYLIEQPVLQRRWPVLWRRSAQVWPLSFAGSVAVMAILTGLLAVNATKPPRVEQILIAAPPSAAPADTGGEAPELGLASTDDAVRGPWSAPTDRPVRVLVVGDSVSVQLGEALQRLGLENPDELVVFNDAHLGCGTTRYGMRRIAADEGGPVGEVCSAWADPVDPAAVADPEVVSWVTATEAFRPDAVVLHVSPWDVGDRIVPSLGDDWTSLGEPDFDAYVVSEYRQAADVLTAHGAQLFLLLGAHLNRPIVEQNSPERIDHLNGLLLDAFEDDPRVTFVDFPAFIGPVGSAREAAMRWDGVHIEPDRLGEAASWLRQEIVGT